MAYSVYILQCADRLFYVGCTNNLEKRLAQLTHMRVVLCFGYYGHDAKPEDF
ncbi:MAG: GIY-YIG nuclease family protein [Minisyncoccia bacterium]|jgi:predicted GIY-YIG superfamily endonuclease